MLMATRVTQLENRTLPSPSVLPDNSHQIQLDGIPQSYSKETFDNCQFNVFTGCTHFITSYQAVNSSIQHNNKTAEMSQKN